MALDDSILLLVFLIFILIIIILLPHFTKCQRKKKKQLKFMLENFVSELDKSNLINNNKTKVAIVTMVNKQPDFDFWLDYHLNHLKIDLVILRVEDSPEYEKMVEKYGDRVIASFHKKNEVNLKHNYFGQMERQEIFVNESIQKAKELGLDYIFHIDSDELIYVHHDTVKNDPEKLLRQYLDEVESEYDCIHFKNFEAVFPDMKNKCFNTNKFIDCKKGQCLSYANGKSVGRVQKGIKFRGCHYFTGKVFDISDHKIAVLHFDSCTYDKWKEKFNLLKDTNEEKLNKIPFKFYKNSIKKMQKCVSDKKNTKECQEDLQKYYQEQKVDPYLTKNTIEMKFN